MPTSMVPYSVMPFQVRLRSSAAWATGSNPAMAMPARTVAESSDLFGAGRRMSPNLLMIFSSGQVNGQEPTRPSSTAEPVALRHLGTGLLQFRYRHRPALSD